MKNIIAALLFCLSLGLIVKFLPLTLANQPTITVTGEAKSDELPQIGRFYAAVSIFNEDKDKAVAEVNSKMNQLIKDLKAFGIEAKDLQTQSVSVNEVNNEVEIMIYPPRPQTKGWQANNSVNITLRDINQATALTDLLQSSGATDISGPDFSLEDTNELKAKLLSLAVKDAQAKAGQAAASGGRKLGRMLTVTEGYSSNPTPFYRGVMMAKEDTAVSAPVEPGTEQFSQTVTVVFALR